jgi:hypothetical protein
MAKADKQADEIAALRAEVDALKAAQPKPQPSAEERERATREWINEMHQMREGNMRYAMHPSVVRDLAVLDDRMVKEIALRDARAPTGPRGAIPNSQQVTGGGGPLPSSTPGYSEPTPLGPPPGVVQADRLMDAQDQRDRAELIERDAKLRAMAKLAEPKHD